jgi:hypothetical protein
MKALLILAIFLASLTSHAQTEPAPLPSPAPPPAEPSKWEKLKDNVTEKAKEAYQVTGEKVKEAQVALSEARDNRSATKWSITGDYSVFETWVLSKYGATIAYNSTPFDTYELEYMKGSFGWGYFGIDIGKISEQKATLLWRSFNQRNTLNFITGIYYDKFDIHLGSDMLATVSGNTQSSVELVELATAGLTWGVGNRWQTKKGFVWGADWFVINVPLTVIREKNSFVDTTTDADKRKETVDAMNVLKHFPAFAVFKVQLGVSF